MKKIFLMLVIGLFGFALTGCDLFAPEEKVFSGSGMTITLNDNFVENDTVLVPLYLASMDYIFMGDREEKSLFVDTEINSLNDYAEAILELGGFTDSTVYESAEGYEYLYAYYSATVDEDEFGYMLICMESDSYYYIMNLGCFLDDLEDSKEQFIEWANTIVVE